MSLRRTTQIGRSLHTTFVASVLVRAGGAVLALMVNIALARLLGVEQYGYYMTLLSAALLLGGLAVRGTNQLLTRELCFGAVAGAEWLRHLKRWAIGRVAIGSAIGAIVYIAWLVLFEFSGSLSGSWAICLAGSLLICMAAFSMLLAGALNGMGAPLRSQCLGLVIQNAGMLIFIGVLWVVFGGLTGGGREGLWLQVAGYGLALLVGGAWLRGRADSVGMISHDKGWVGGMRTTAKDWSYAARNFFFIALASLLINRLDVVLVSALSNKETTGVYAAGARLAQIALVVALAVNTVLSPRISEAWSKKDGVALRGLLRGGLLITFPIAILEVVVAFVFAPTIIKLFGGDYSASSSVFFWVVVAYAAWTLCAPEYAFLAMSGSEKWVALLSWLVLVCNIVGMILLVPKYGAIGGGEAMAIGYGVALVGLLIGLALKSHYASRLA